MVFSKPVSPSEQACIPPEDLDRVTKEAQGRDAPLQSIRRLYEHYAICWNDRGQAWHWAMLGAKRGDKELQGEVIGMLLITRTPEDTAEANRLMKQWSWSED